MASVLFIKWLAVDVCRLPDEDEDRVAYNLRGSCGIASNK